MSNKASILQEQLAKYCRTGENPPNSSLPKHIPQYRRLVYSVVNKSLQRAFPIFYNVVGQINFEAAVKFFLAENKVNEPQVWRLPKVFFEFYENQPFPFEENVPFLRELLHFEWLEIEVFLMPDEDILPFTTKGNIEFDQLVLNPEIRVIGLHYPIHQKAVKQITETDKGNYFVSIHRDYYTKQVHFNELAAVHVQILNHLLQSTANLQEILPIMTQTVNKEIAVKKCLEFIEFALQQGIILGYKATN